jgi:16S rRNA (guanine(966)-N(2))-methyltransferase RsmD
MSRIRITGGEWRSRLINVTDAPGLRPTPYRVRETLFNWLGQDLGGLRCLDLFAGSGILGFESASRGAALVTLVEQNRRAFLQLRNNAERFNDVRLQPICANALKFAAQGEAGYDLIFLDPPYRQGWLEKVESLLPQLSNPGARVYAEAEHRLECLGDWHVLKQGVAGQVYFHLLERE